MHRTSEVSVVGRRIKTKGLNPSSLALVALLSACAAPLPTQPPKPPAVVNTSPPRCTGQVECGQMWVHAQEVLQQMTGMRLRIVTDSRIETFAATSFGRTSGVVVKYPVSADTFDLLVEISCYGRYTDCGDLRASGANLFNLRVGGSAVMQKHAAQPTTAPNGAAPASDERLPKSTEPPPRDAFAAERFAKSAGCADMPATLIGRGPGYETFSFRCTNGDTLVVQCQWGNCRALK